ncbi:MAG: T9SS type A sorting domain-containing protein [Ignavibacteriaceae bacterium]
MEKKILFLLIILFSFSATGLLAQRKIQFSGINWYVRNDPGGPGPNEWSDSNNNVWVDSSGYLHLKITKVGNTWYCSEIYTDKSFGYGKYIFQLANNVEKYDQNIIVGLFTYENDSREIDIEFSRWGDPKSDAGWYTVQPPPYTSQNERHFPLHLSDDYSSHIIHWTKDSINFQSYRGNFDKVPSADSLIWQWTYKGSKNPPVGNERLHINFWLLEGHAPVNNKEAELIIKSVSVIVPAGSLKIIIIPEDAVNAGAKWSLDNGPWQNNNTIISGLPAGKHRVDFKHIDGWVSPQGKNIYIAGESVIYDTARYIMATDIKQQLNYNLPKKYKLDQNFPNPFNPSTKIVYSIPGNSSFNENNPARTILYIFDELGCRIATLVDETEFAGTYEVTFNADDLSSGIYFYQLKHGGFNQTKKMLLLR